MGIRKLHLLGILHSTLALASGGQLRELRLGLELQEWVPESLIEETLTSERKIGALAKLEEVGPQKRYRFVALMPVAPSVSQTELKVREVSKFVGSLPYVERAKYDEAKRTLDIRGGIFSYVLESVLQFEAFRPQEIKFHVIQGHLSGLRGQVRFHSLKERGTLVALQGEILGGEYPPAWIMEKGAEIALTVAGKKLRNMIESETPLSSDLPTPKKRFF
jgi:hypothetical protein